MRTFLRRSLTIVALLGLTLALTTCLPILLLVAAGMSTLPACRGAVPTFLFVLGYLWCESLGILAAFWVWLRYHRPDEFIAANYRLQYWWSNALKVLGARLFRLDIVGNLLFCAHQGFEGSSHFGNLINGSWVGARIGIRFWRVAFSDIPRERNAQIEFVFRQWDRMEREVEGMAAAAKR